MRLARLTKLQGSINSPLLIKKKENLLYLTGRSFMHGYLLVKPTGADSRGKRTTRIYEEQKSVIFFGDGLEKSPAVKSDRLKNIGLYLGGSKNLLLEDEFTFKESSYIRNKINNPPHPAFGHPLPKGEGRIRVAHARSPVDFQRQIKEPGEIALIKKSMRIVGQVFNWVRREIKKPGITEIKLAQFIQSSGLKMGAEDVSFPAIVASGKNAAVPHHVPSSKRLKAGESIIIDFGFKYKNYCSDFTRTVFLKKVHPKLEKAYIQVEKAYLESMLIFFNPSRVQPRGLLSPNKQISHFVRNGRQITGNDLYQRAVDVLAEAKLDKYFIHSLGHGTGLEIHELPNLSPNSRDILKPGMVFSIEPGVYIPNLGGIRIEDLVVLKRDFTERFINISTKLKDNII